MKTIKFRGKDILTGKMIYGDLIHARGELLILEKDKKVAKTVDKNSVAQFVGYDKDNNEIYEGDEIKSRFGSFCYANFRHYGEIIDGAYSLVQTRIIN